MPLESDEYRCTPNGHCIVWRTKDAGESWEPLTDGLPQQDAHLTVLRDGFTSDGQDPAGLYVGTRTGEVYASTDDGESWRLLAEHLPPVMSVRAARDRLIRPMEVRVRVPTQLRDLVGGAAVVTVDVVAVGDGTATVGDGARRPRHAAPGARAAGP